MRWRAERSCAGSRGSGQPHRYGPVEAIIGGRFAPGARLNEVHLAAEIGVSRAPLREAARLLENRGLVVSQPRRGFFVRDLTAAALDDAYDLRLCLERHAGRAVCATLTAEMRRPSGPRPRASTKPAAIPAGR